VVRCIVTELRVVPEGEQIPNLIKQNCLALFFRDAPADYDYPTAAVASCRLVFELGRVFVLQFQMNILVSMGETIARVVRSLIMLFGEHPA
jgi:hypothetical protein